MAINQGEREKNALYVLKSADPENGRGALSSKRETPHTDRRALKDPPEGVVIVGNTWGRRGINGKTFSDIGRCFCPKEGNLSSQKVEMLGTSKKRGGFRKEYWP